MDAGVLNRQSWSFRCWHRIEPDELIKKAGDVEKVAEPPLGVCVFMWRTSGCIQPAASDKKGPHERPVLCHM